MSAEQTGVDDGPFAGATHRLGEALVESGRITESQLAEGLTRQKQTGQFLGEVLVEMGHIGQEELTPFLVKHCRIPYVSLLDYLVDPALLSHVPEEICKKYRVLPVDKLGKNLTVAMVNPMNPKAIEAVQAACEGLRIKPILCDFSHFQSVADRLFGADKGKTAKSVSMESLGLGAGQPAKAPPAPKSAPPPPKAPEPKPESAAPASSAPPPKPALQVKPAASARSALAQSLNDAMQDVMTVARSSMHDTYEILARRIDLFRGLKIEEVAALFACGATRELESDQIVFEKGQAGTDLYVILGGKVRIVDEGKEIAILSTGDMFGEMALVTGEPRSASAITADTTSLFVLNEAVFQRLLSKQVAIRILLNMLGTMSLRLKQSNDLLRKIVQ